MYRLLRAGLSNRRGHWERHLRRARTSFLILGGLVHARQDFLVAVPCLVRHPEEQLDQVNKRRRFPRLNVDDHVQVFLRMSTDVPDLP
jgi:hypothetical protein